MDILASGADQLSAQRYVSMLIDINQHATDLLFSLHSPAKAKLVTRSRDKGPSALREFQLVQYIMDELDLIMARIRRNPCHSLQGSIESRLLHEIRQFSNEALPIPGPFVAPATPDNAPHLPLTWAVRQNKPTYDVYENRLLKHFIHNQLLTKIRNIQRNIDREMEIHLQSRDLKRRNGWEDDETPKIAALEQRWTESQYWIQKCSTWQGEPFLTSVRTSFSTNKVSQFLLKNPDYNRFYRLYLYFQRELKLNLDANDFLSALTLHKTSELYKHWSILQVTCIIINRLIKADYTLTSSNLFYEIEKDRFQFEIKKNTSSIVLAKGNKRVEIKYEPLYKKELVSSMKGLVSLYSEQLIPDMAVEVYMEDTIKHVIVFDAKYKHRDYEDEAYPEEEDIDNTSRYRDAIRYWVRNSRYPNRKPQRIVSSSYILYPGTHLQHIPDKPEVGALPILPDIQEDRWRDVEDAVRDMLRFAGVR